MSRFTKKIENHYIIECPNLFNYIDGRNQLKELLSTQDKGIQKLGELEDIEEQLGIDSKIILKVIMTMKVWAIQNGRIRRFYVTDIVSYKKILKGYITFGDTHNGWCTEEEIKFEDYGITWALTKEELTKKELL